MSKEFNDWKESRKVTSFNGLPQSFQKELKEFICVYNPDDVYIMGSYANGDWITEDTPQYFKDLKKRIKYKNKVSDLDIIVEPDVGVYTFKSLHINQLKTTGVHIYGNNQFK